MKAKLKTFDNVLKNCSKSHGTKYVTRISHSLKKGLWLTINNKSLFGSEIDISLYMTKCNPDRIIYKDVYNNSYYDEWFEWIGKPKEFIPKELWEI